MSSQKNSSDGRVQDNSFESIWKSRFFLLESIHVPPHVHKHQSFNPFFYGGFTALLPKANVQPPRNFCLALGFMEHSCFVTYYKSLP